MPANPVLDQLRQRIHSLEDVQRRFSRTISITDAVDQWLPFGGLPTGSIHEVKGTSLACAIVFSAILSARIACESGNVVYVAPDRSQYPLGLLPYDVRLERILHVSARRPQNRLWAVMEALRCPQVSSVVAMVDDLDLKESRRLQLAAENSGVTGFFLGGTASPGIATPVTRWKISPVRGALRQRFDEPRWELELLYCRGGRPGKWTIEWRGKKLSAVAAMPEQQFRQEALAG